MEFLLSEPKFKVGDKVRVRTDLVEGERYWMDDGDVENAYVGSMVSFAGKVVTIASAGTQYHIDEDYGCWWWTDGMFEDPDETIAEVTDLI